MDGHVGVGPEPGWPYQVRDLIKARERAARPSRALAGTNVDLQMDEDEPNERSRAAPGQCGSPAVSSAGAAARRAQSGAMRTDPGPLRPTRCRTALHSHLGCFRLGLCITSAPQRPPRACCLWRGFEKGGAQRISIYQHASAQGRACLASTGRQGLLRCVVRATWQAEVTNSQMT